MRARDQDLAEVDEPVLNTAQAGRLLGFSTKSVRALCEAGRLPGAYRLTITGHWRIPLSVIKAVQAGMKPRRRLPGS